MARLTVRSELQQFRTPICKHLFIIEQVCGYEEVLIHSRPKRWILLCRRGKAERDPVAYEDCASYEDEEAAYGPGTENGGGTFAA